MNFKNLLLVFILILLTSISLLLIGCEQEIDKADEEKTTKKEYEEVLKVPDDYETIQEAIQESEDGEVIEVKPGTYEENIDFEGKNITLRSTDPQDKEIVSDTIINGKNNGPAVIFKNVEKALLKGFTITGGSGLEIEVVDGEKHFHGGGVLLDNSKPTIKNNIIDNNSADLGGGIFVGFNSRVSIENNTVSENRARLGGGIYVRKSKADLNNNNKITRNTADGGAGIYTWEAEVSIKDSAFNENIADGGGGGIVIDYNSITTIKDSIFNKNSAEQDGGGIFIRDSEITLTNSSVTKNNASSGGGIHVHDDSIATIVDNNNIENNTASLEGGGISVHKSKADIKNNDINKNQSGFGGGGISSGDNSKVSIKNNNIGNNIAEAHGGGINVISDHYTIEDNSLIENEPDDVAPDGVTIE